MSIYIQKNQVKLSSYIPNSKSKITLSGGLQIFRTSENWPVFKILHQKQRQQN